LQVAGVENGDSVDAVAELHTPPLVVPTTQQVGANRAFFSLHVPLR
jgi:hypothetical protein